MSDEFYGQMSVFDITDEKHPGYTFKRYVGQSVRHRCGVVGKITKISRVYTTFVDADGKEYVATSFDLEPFEPEVDKMRIAYGHVTPVEFDDEEDEK